MFHSFQPFYKVLKPHALLIRDLQKLIVNFRPKFEATAEPHYGGQLFGQISDPGTPFLFSPSQKDGLLAPSKFHIFHLSASFSELRGASVPPRQVPWEKSYILRIRFAPQTVPEIFVPYHMRRKFLIRDRRHFLPLHKRTES